MNLHLNLNRKALQLLEKEELIELLLQMAPPPSMDPRSLEETSIDHAISDDKVKLLGALAGDMAHEINNPLLVLNGYLVKLEQLLRDHENPKIHKALERISSMSLRIQYIVRGVLKFARSDDLSFDVGEELIDQIIDDTLLLIDHKMQSQGVRFTLKKQAKSIKLQCAAVQISQILLNLLTNALDAVSGTYDPWVELHVDKDPQKNILILKIVDSGKGIPQAIADKIFQRGYTSKDVGKGNGLGLGIARRVAEAHGGSLDLDPKNPHTCFVLSIPLDLEEEKIKVL